MTLIKSMTDCAGTGLTQNKVNSGRKGLLIPIILGVLTVFLILIFIIIRTSTETYTGVALINHHLHARMIAFAVMEEAAVMVREGIAHEAISGRKANQWHRNDILAAIFSNKGEYIIDIKDELKTIDYLYGTVSRDPYGVNDPGGFSGGERVLPQKKEANLPQIMAATVRFHNFKNIQFSHANIYNNPAAYYVNPLGFGSGPPRGDYFGFYTVNVKIKFGVVEQNMQLTRDVKVVNNEPIARAYAFFSADTPPMQKQTSDLNSPGKLYVNAANQGRIFIQGPYMLDVEGSPDGTSEPGPIGLGYPTPANTGSWDGFGFLPTPRAITTCATMSSSVERPKSKSGSGVTMGIGADCFAFNLGSDPGLKAMPEAQNYWAASAEAGTQNFSIAGLPNEFRGWQGLLYRKNAASNSQVAPFSGDFNSISMDMEARIEGMLIGRYNMINFLKFHACTSVSAIAGAIGSVIPSGEETDPEISSLDEPTGDDEEDDEEETEDILKFVDDLPLLANFDVKTYFDAYSYGMTQASKDAIDNDPNIKQMCQFREIIENVHIIGHTAGSASGKMPIFSAPGEPDGEATMQELSEKRANAVAGLIKGKIGPELSVTTEGKGGVEYDQAASDAVAAGIGKPDQTPYRKVEFQVKVKPQAEAQEYLRTILKDNEALREEYKKMAEDSSYVREGC